MTSLLLWLLPLFFSENSIAFMPPPVVQWLEPQEYDFGEIGHNKPVSVKFSFKNISDSPLILQTVRTTCGCTAASWTETPIPAGETGEVRIEYDAYQQGGFDKKIKVFFDKQRKPETLRIFGTVISD
ncbi:MAG: DUF1573 domain-containing protein [Bacteroidota bacterium]